MPESRYLILLAGIVGVLAMFQPMIVIGRGPLKVKTSAYELSFGLDRVHKAINKKLPGFVEKRIPPDVLQTRDDIKLVADASRGAALAYLPSLIILLLGAFSVWRKRTDLAVAIAAIPLALVSIAAWFGVRYGVAYGREEEPALARLHLELQWASHVMLVVGIVVLVAVGRDLLERRRTAKT
ncbi:MAG TPA: hypothetical protein VFV99_05055 [Kofleriaceae bacterium]|nr:hypothetical protein [Kofleriaceae bacterium]